MELFTVKFNGRKKGAIGVTYPITETVKAEDKESVRLALYDNYEHIIIDSITQLKGSNYSTNDLLNDCELDRQDFKKRSVTAMHYHVLEHHHDKLKYVLMHRKEGSITRAWCYAGDVDHGVVFDTAEGFRSEGETVAVYKVLKGDMPTLGALNVFCNWEEEHILRAKLPVKCEYRVI